VRNQDRNRLLSRCACEGGLDSVTPELQTKLPHLRSGDCIGYTGNLEVEGADSEVSGEGGSWNEGAEG
jgi:hypothetical protein